MPKKYILVTVTADMWAYQVPQMPPKKVIRNQSFQTVDRSKGMLGKGMWFNLFAMDTAPFWLCKLRWRESLPGLT